MKTLTQDLTDEDINFILDLYDKVPPRAQRRTVAELSLRLEEATGRLQILQEDIKSALRLMSSPNCDRARALLEGALEKTT